MPHRDLRAEPVQALRLDHMDIARYLKSNDCLLTKDAATVMLSDSEFRHIKAVLSAESASAFVQLLTNP